MICFWGTYCSVVHQKIKHFSFDKIPIPDIIVIPQRTFQKGKNYFDLEFVIYSIPAFWFKRECSHHDAGILEKMFIGEKTYLFHRFTSKTVTILTVVVLEDIVKHTTLVSCAWYSNCYIPYTIHVRMLFVVVSYDIIVRYDLFLLNFTSYMPSNAGKIARLSYFLLL